MSARDSGRAGNVYQFPVLASALMHAAGSARRPGVVAVYIPADTPVHQIAAALSGVGLRMGSVDSGTLVARWDNAASGADERGAPVFVWDESWTRADAIAYLNGDNFTRLTSKQLGRLVYLLAGCLEQNGDGL